MNKKQQRQILNILEKTYAGKGTALKFSNPFELLVATILSAQCTDERVNKVTPELFERFGNPVLMSQASVSEVEEYVRTCGLFRNKAKNLVAASKKLVEEFDGRVPDTMGDLLTLPGVGRKTANVVLSNAFQRDAIAVDTHVFRVANRLGLVKADNPRKTEEGLMKVIPKEKWSEAHHWLIHHGRALCTARKPACLQCPLKEQCKTLLNK